MKLRNRAVALIPSWNNLVVYSALDSIYARKRNLAAATQHAGETEVTILARILGNERG
jgi:hypothetical protein